jgi:hypothetical protein
LNALNANCSVLYFGPGVYYFAFNDTNETSNNKNNTWVTQNIVEAGTPTKPGLTPDVKADTKACSPFETYASGTGAVFIFGGRTNWKIDKNSQVGLCAKVMAGQPPIGVYGLKSPVTSGSVTMPAQTGCTLADKDGTSSKCPTLSTTNANNVTLYFESSTYLPHGWVDLQLQSPLQYITGGLVVRQFSLMSPASSVLPAPLSSGPLPGGPGGGRTVVYLTVYVCPGGGSCTSGGTLRLKAKVDISDPNGPPAPNGLRQITVLSWSVQR